MIFFTDNQDWTLNLPKTSLILSESKKLFKRNAFEQPSNFRYASLLRLLL